MGFRNSARYRKEVVTIKLTIKKNIIDIANTYERNIESALEFLMNYIDIKCAKELIVTIPAIDNLIEDDQIEINDDLYKRIEKEFELEASEKRIRDNYVEKLVIVALFLPEV